MKRSPLKRKTPLRAKPGRKSPPRTKYKSRERDWAFMLFVKTLPCWASSISRCDGPIEADHTGDRGVGRKAADSTCIPLCTLHHRCRTDWSGPFRDWTQAAMRAWLALGRDAVRAAAEKRAQELRVAELDNQDAKHHCSSQQVEE